MHSLEPGKCFSWSPSFREVILHSGYQQTSSLWSRLMDAGECDVSVGPRTDWRAAMAPVVGSRRRSERLSSGGQAVLPDVPELRPVFLPVRRSVLPELLVSGSCHSRSRRRCSVSVRKTIRLNGKKGFTSKQTFAMSVMVFALSISFRWSIFTLRRLCVQRTIRTERTERTPYL